jgi:ADP-ribosylglycohydrolase
MISDDTEHTCLMAQSWIEAAGDLPRFQAALARRFRWWLLGMPAGIGLATLRATLRLWLGFSPERSGVYSAGNGPAMRAALLGVLFEDRQRLAEWVRVCTRLTHTDPRAERGALVVAHVAHLAARDGWNRPHDVLAPLLSCLPGARDELAQRIAEVVDSVERQESTAAYAARLGLARGVTGYVNHTVPVALHASLSFPTDVRGAVMAVVACGGDTDTTAAIAGGIVGAGVGRNGIPTDWLNQLTDWPRSVAWMDRLAQSLWEARSSSVATRPPGVSLPGLLLRNVLFAGVVLGHGLRRLGPPY